MRKFFFFFSCAALIIFSIYMLHTAKQHTAPVAVEITKAKQKDIYNSIVASGTVTNTGSYEVVFAEDSTIQELYVTVGQPVEKGDIIMKRDAPTSSDMFMKGASTVTEQILSAFAEYGITIEDLHLPTVLSNQCTVKSPVDGIVCELNAVEKKTMNGFEVAATIVNFNEMQVSVELPEMYLSSVLPGQDVKITGDAFPEKEYTGVVKKIASSASKKNSILGDSKTYVPITISLKNADHKLKPGYNVSAKICTEKRRDAVVLPYDCIVQDETGRELIFVVSENRIVQKRIITGLELPEETEVLYGLSKGESVVRKPEKTLKNGQKVMVKNET